MTCQENSLLAWSVCKGESTKYQGRLAAGQLAHIPGREGPFTDTLFGVFDFTFTRQDTLDILDKDNAKANGRYNPDRVTTLALKDSIPADCGTVQARLSRSTTSGLPSTTVLLADQLASPVLVRNCGPQAYRGPRLPLLSSPS